MALSVQQKLEKGYQIWVRNMTAKPAAMIALTFKYNGSQQLVKIPPGKYPYCLYPGMLSKDMIANGGMQLQHFLATGALRLITKKKAKKMLASPDAREEQKALYHRANNDAANIRWAKKQRRIAEGIESANPEFDEDRDEYVHGPQGLPDRADLLKPPIERIKEKLASEGDGPSRARFQLAQNSVDPDVQGRVIGIMTGWTLETDEGVLRQLKAMRSQLTPRDLHYVMRSCQRRCRTYNWAGQIVDKVDI